MLLEAITTERLELVPFDEATARAVLRGDLSNLEAAAGWPHEDTADGLSMALEHGDPPGWMIMLDAKVIGDCGTHGPADPDGVIEIGYGLAEPFRGHGHGTEVVGALTGWLLAQPGIEAVCASTLADNLASRRVLNKNGFSFTGHNDDGEATYRRSDSRR